MFHGTLSTLGDEKNKGKIGSTIQELNQPLDSLIFLFSFILVHYLQKRVSFVAFPVVVFTLPHSSCKNYLARTMSSHNNAISKQGI
jgi:hypothetical protein